MTKGLTDMYVWTHPNPRYDDYQKADFSQDALGQWWLRRYAYAWILVPEPRHVLQAEPWLLMGEQEAVTGPCPAQPVRLSRHKARLPKNVLMEFLSKEKSK